MRIAVLADVHANLAALEAVLEALDSVAVDRVVCLGDLVGYHARPRECIAAIRATADDVVAGNHDRDALAGASPGTHAVARRAQDWTCAVLSPADAAYLAALPRLVVTERFVAAHGSYLSDTYVSGYVTSTMLEDNLRAISARDGWPRIAFCGHTHVPMVAWWDGHAVAESKVGQPERWPRRARCVLANPGAVGQPRDGDTRASFGIIDLDTRVFEVRRVTYDIERTCREISDAGLPEELAVRLREGR